MGNGRELNEQAQMARGILEERLRILPIPAAAPRYSSGASIGVSLLDAALNADHVVRRSEHLTIVDRSHLVRRLSIRVSLDRLTPDQRAAGMAYGQFKEASDEGRAESPYGPWGRRSSPADGAPTDESEPQPALIWVPITTVSRSTAAPVRILDSEQREVPRATQAEILPLVNAALYSLIRAVLEAEPDAQVASTPLHDLLHKSNRARWLLEAAFASMIYDHAHVDDGLVTPRARAGGRAGAGCEAAKVRELARRVVDGYVARHAAFLELLHHCSTRIVVVAGLLARKREQYLSYEAPALPAEETRRSAIPWGRQFTFRYKLYLPPSLDTYHATIETDPGVRIREAVMTTGDGQSGCEELVTGLRQLAAAVGEMRRQGTPTTFAEYELGSMAARLDEIATNRLDSWRVYRDHWRSESHIRPPVRSGVGRPASDLLELNRALGDVREDDYRGTLAAEPDAEERLDDMATVVEQLELGTDLAVDDDPRSNIAHMYWQRRPPRGSRSQPRAVPVSIHVALVDDPSPFLGSVASWLGALCALVFFVGVALFGDWDWPLPWSSCTVDVASTARAADGSSDVEIDPLVAVLLIVPTLLVTRLELPRGSTLAGRLRTLDRWSAYAAILVMAAISLTVATRLSSPWAMSMVFTRGLYLLAGLFVVTAVDLYVGRRKSRRPSRAELHLPRWVRDRGRWSRRRRYDAEFDGVG